MPTPPTDQHSGSRQNVTAEAKRYLLRNIAGNTLFSAFSVVARIWLTPFVIGNVGIAAFGLVSFVQSLLTGTFFVQSSLGTIITRFISISHNSNQPDKARQYFNSALFGVAVVSILSFIVAAGLGLFLNRDSAGATQADLTAFVLISATALALDTFATIFSIGTFVRHRFDIASLVQVLGLSAKVALTATLFIVFPARLTWLACANLVQSVLVIGLLAITHRRLVPYLNISPRLIRFPLVSEIARSGVWNVLNTLGSFLYINTNIIMIKLIAGNVAAGLFGPFLQVTNMVVLFTTSIGKILWPITYDSIARGESQKTAEVIKRSIRLLSYVKALPLALLCGFARPVVHAWLPAEYASQTLTLSILMAGRMLCSAGDPLLAYSVGINKVRPATVSTLVGGAINIVLSYCVLKFTSFGLPGIAAVLSITLAVRNTVFLPWYFARPLQVSPWSLQRELIMPVIAFTGLSALCYAVSNTVIGYGYAGLAVAVILASLVYAGACMGLLLPLSDRQLLISMISKPFARRIKKGPVS